jgi:hypothetical protein
MPWSCLSVVWIALLISCGRDGHVYTAPVGKITEIYDGDPVSGILVEEYPGIQRGDKARWWIGPATMIRLDLQNGNKRTGTRDDLRLGASVIVRTSQVIQTSSPSESGADEVVVVSY